MKTELRRHLKRGKWGGELLTKVCAQKGGPDTLDPLWIRETLIETDGWRKQFDREKRGRGRCRELGQMD